MTDTKPLPDTQNALTRPFWEGLRNEELKVQRCDSCLVIRYPPAPICPECLQPAGTWIAITSEGALWSYVIYHRALTPSFADSVPYAVGVVELEKHIHILARIEAPLNGLRIGMSMRAKFDHVTDEVTLLRWIPATEGTPDLV